MGLRDQLKKAGQQALSRGLDEVARRIYGGNKQQWSEEQRAAGVILSGSSRTAIEEADRLAREVGYQVETRPDPASDITRPRAGRTFGARFEHYPILAPDVPLPAKASEAIWTLDRALWPHVRQGSAEYKERLVLAFTTVSCEASERLEDQLLELHPILEPQCVVLFMRVGHRGEERFFRRVRLGDVILTLPHVPCALFFSFQADGTLHYKSLAHDQLDAAAPRFGVLNLLEGRSYVPPGMEGMLEIQEQKGRHRSKSKEGYPRPFVAHLDKSSV